ncbi:ATP-binding Cassette (ABC) Superfamily [Thraustotheca clavata]|uniref:ATP-binding Cassette (ABC) Superfamily n=1 Tax=Thraustotheca clavata TaxID=74557 RepID=A0A1W0A1K4_9STRA|nr:ATP-binding Cassette (ABC) Superfamily [Thraustotheca clavata]
MPPMYMATDASNGGFHREIHPKSSANWISRAFYLWVSPLLSLGNQRQLNHEDLWPLEYEYQCRTVSRVFERDLRRNKSIFRTIFGLYGRRFGCIGCVQAVVVGCTLYAPFVLHRIVSAAEAATYDMQHVLVVIFTLYLVKVVQALLTTHAAFETQLITLKITSALQHLLFQKALVLDATCRREKSTGEIANMFSTDIQSIINFSVAANQLWIFPLQTIAILSMLHDVIGYAAFVGAGVIGVVLVINNCLATKQRSVFRKLMELKDARMKAVSEIFGAMQIIKLNAWEEKFYEKLTALRTFELGTLRNVYFLQSFWVALLLAAPIFVTIASIGTYTLVMKEALTAAKVFTALSLFSMLRFPMMALPQVIANLMQALVAARRMMQFLDLPEKNVSETWTPKTHPTECKPFQSLRFDIVVQDGTFGWNGLDNPLFRNINLTIKKGEFVVVHGIVGEGKSSLIAALLGEMQKASKSIVYLGGDVAYFSQQPWIQNMTIRENILFGRPYDRKKYTRVLEACALVKDLALFPAGDRTEIGQKGVNISGGQKARIGLARACYSDADIFLLDSPLSAVDAIVQNDIFYKCFQGLLKNKTIVLVTHSPEIISSKFIDRTLEIRGGRIFDTVVDHSSEEELPVLVQPMSRSSSRSGADEDHDDIAPTPDLTLVSPALAAFEVFTPTSAQISGPVYEYDEENSPTGQLIMQEMRSKGRVSSKIFKTYVAAIGGWKIILLWACILFTGQTMQVAGDLHLGTWSSSIQSFDASKYYLASYTCLALGGILCCALRTVSIFVGGLKASNLLFDRMTHALLRAPMQFFDMNPLGRILNRFSNDINTVDIQLPMLLDPFTGVIFSVFVQLITTVLVIKFAGLLLVPLIYIYCSIAGFYVQPAREMERVNKATKSPMLNLISECIDGALIIRAFGQRHMRRFQQTHHANVDATNGAMYTSQIMTQWFLMRVQLLSAHLVIFVALSLVYMQDYLTPGLIGLVLNYTFNMLPSLEYIVSIGSQVETSMVGPERIAEYCAVESEPPRVISGAVPKSWPERGAISFKNMSFRYKPWDPLVLKNVNVDIAAGEKIGIVGRTGAGKSSLTMALFRINELASGSIEIDGVNVAKIGIQTLRQSIAIIPQSPVLFKGSIRSYLDPFNTVDDDTLWRTLGKVNMLDRIKTDGLETGIDENGENFSVGERQMLCMARALLRDARIVVMDEATAAIDHATDLTLQRVIRTEFASSTVLTIAHRLDTILDCDRILVFDCGRVAQCDRPQKLIEKGQGIFYELCQEGGYLDKILKQTSPKAACM